MLQRRLELCGEAPRAPMQPCKRGVRPPTGSPPAHGRSPPEQVQSEKSQGVRGTEAPDSFSNIAKKPRITCPFFRGKYRQHSAEKETAQDQSNRRPDLNEQSVQLPQWK